MILQLPSQSSSMPLSWFTHTHIYPHCYSRMHVPPTILLPLSFLLSGFLGRCGLCPWCVALHSKEEMRLPIEVIMDFDSPSCVPTTTTLRCCCCCSRLLRRCTLPYAVCLMPFLLYDYIRCSFFALISLICLCWRRLADAFVVAVAFSISTYGMQHAAVFRCCLPPPLFFSLSCALSQNDFKQVRIRDAVVVVVQVHSKSDYVCLCNCV